MFRAEEFSYDSEIVTNFVFFTFEKKLFGSMEPQIRGAVHRLAHKTRYRTLFSWNSHSSPTCESPLGTKNPTSRRQKIDFVVAMTQKVLFYFF